MVSAAIKNDISKDLVLDWQSQLDKAEIEGRFAFTVISILTSAFSV